MADPASLAVISMASSAASAGVGAYGAMQSGAAKQAMYQYQAGIAQMNAKIAQRNAEQALVTGEKEASLSGMKSRAMMGRIKTAQAASGIDMNTGTNAALQDSATKVARMDQSQLRENAGKKYYAYEVDKANQIAQSGLYSMAGANAEAEGKIAALTSILGGVGSVSSKWMQAKGPGGAFT